MNEFIDFMMSLYFCFETTVSPKISAPEDVAKPRTDGN